MPGKRLTSRTARIRIAPHKRPWGSGVRRPDAALHLRHLNRMLFLNGDDNLDSVITVQIHPKDLETKICGEDDFGHELRVGALFRNAQIERDNLSPTFKEEEQHVHFVTLVGFEKLLSGFLSRGAGWIAWQQLFPTGATFRPETNRMFV
jgi:hypothetical protein